MEDINRSTDRFSYEFYLGAEGEEANSVSIEIDGQPFATGSAMGCELEYESPTWLDTMPNGDVQWSVTSRFVKTCDIGGGFNFLGVEEYTVVESDNVKYPMGRTVRKVITGKIQETGDE